MELLGKVVASNVSDGLQNLAITEIGRAHV